eukprot:227489-Pleurochrysis_carterae.AAC.1
MKSSSIIFELLYYATSQSEMYPYLGMSSIRVIIRSPRRAACTEGLLKKRHVLALSRPSR